VHILITRRAPLDTPDGINISIFSLADALLALGHRVTMVSSTASDAVRLQELYGLRRVPDVVALSDRQGWDGSYRRLMTPWIRRGSQMVNRLKPDLVIVNGALPIRFGAPTVIVSHDLEARFSRLGPFRHWYKRWTYRQATWIAATTTEIRDLLAREIGRPRDSIVVIPTCFDLAGYTSRPIEARENAILHMGTVDYKNPTATLRAFARIAGNPTLYLTGPSNPTLVAELAALPPGTRERVVLLGYVSAADLRDLLGRVRVVSVPSVYAVPVASPTVVEPFASGTPVVASRAITRDLLIDDRNGLVTALEPDPMARAFERLLTDDELWRRLSVEALATSAGFGAGPIAEQYLALLNRPV
jgi:glycosyltransferase involved in cell wall biosynthesis